MKLMVMELDGGEYFHGTAFTDDYKEELFDVELVEWLSGVEKCIVKSYKDGKIYRVHGDWTMEEIRSSR